ncbi:MAG: hypothetical protein JW734_00290 [Candidatus Omnitrophica bacterium]|nr:hypothetical protein [Candidatus Omnitrophota bacterium]
MKNYLFFITFLIAGLAFSSQLLAEDKVIEGRLYQDKNLLFLVDKDGFTYAFTGGNQELKKALLNLGPENKAVVQAEVTDAVQTNCESKVEFDVMEERNITVKCVQYTVIAAKKIVSVGKSGEDFPLPKRNPELERMHFKETSKSADATLKNPGAVEGTITYINFKSPIKTFQVEDGKTKNKVNLVITPATSVYIAKNNQPFQVSELSLKSGQKVFVAFSWTIKKNEADVITIIE